MNATDQALKLITRTGVQELFQTFATSSGIAGKLASMDGSLILNLIDRDYRSIIDPDRGVSFFGKEEDIKKFYGSLYGLILLLRTSFRYKEEEGSKQFNYTRWDESIKPTLSVMIEALSNLAGRNLATDKRFVRYLMFILINTEALQNKWNNIHSVRELFTEVRNSYYSGAPITLSNTIASLENIENAMAGNFDKLEISTLLSPFSQILNVFKGFEGFFREFKRLASADTNLSMVLPTILNKASKATAEAIAGLEIGKKAVVTEVQNEVFSFLNEHLGEDIGTVLQIVKDSALSGDKAKMMAAIPVVFSKLGKAGFPVEFSGSLGTVLSMITMLLPLADDMGTVISELLDHILDTSGDLVEGVVGKVFNMAGDTISDVLSGAFDFVGDAGDWISDTWDDVTDWF